MVSCVLGQVTYRSDHGPDIDRITDRNKEPSSTHTYTHTHTHTHTGLPTASTFIFISQGWPMKEAVAGKLVHLKK